MEKIKELKSNLDLMKIGNDDTFYREELIFWESNAQKSLSLNKKETISTLLKTLVAKSLRKGSEGKIVKSNAQLKTKLKVNFSNDLNEDVKSYSENEIKHSLDFLGVILSKYSGVTSDVECTCSAKKIRIVIKFLLDPNDKNIDIDFSLVRDEYNSVSMGTELGIMKCYKSKEDDAVLVYVDFERVSGKNNLKEKNIRNTERQYEV